jgi:hypothetical protein
MATANATAPSVLPEILTCAAIAASRSPHLSMRRAAVSSTDRPLPGVEEDVARSAK